MSFSHSDWDVRGSVDYTQGFIERAAKNLISQVSIALARPTTHKTRHRAYFLSQALFPKLTKLFNEVVLPATILDINKNFSKLKTELTSGQMAIPQGAANFGVLRDRKKRLLVGVLDLYWLLTRIKFHLHQFNGPHVFALDELRKIQARIHHLTGKNETNFVSKIDLKVADAVSAYESQLDCVLKEFNETLQQREQTFQQKFLELTAQGDEVDSICRGIGKHVIDIKGYQFRSKSQRIKEIEAILEKLQKELNDVYGDKHAVSLEDEDKIERVLGGFEQEMMRLVGDGKQLIESAAKWQRTKKEYIDGMAHKRRMCLETLQAENSIDKEALTRSLPVAGKYFSKNILEVNKIHLGNLQQNVLCYRSEIEDIRVLDESLQRMHMTTMQKFPLVIDFAVINSDILRLQQALKNFQLTCYDQVSMGGHTHLLGALKEGYLPWKGIECLIEKEATQIPGMANNAVTKMHSLLSDEAIADKVDVGEDLTKLAKQVGMEIKKAAEVMQLKVQAAERQYEAENLELEHAIVAFQSELSHKYTAYLQARDKSFVEYIEKLNLLAERIKKINPKIVFPNIAVPKKVITDKFVKSVREKINKIRSTLINIDFNIPRESPNFLQRHNILIFSSVGAGAVVGGGTGAFLAPFTLGVSIPVGAAVGILFGFIGGIVAGAVSECLCWIKTKIVSLPLNNIFLRHSQPKPARSKKSTPKLPRRRSSFSSVDMYKALQSSNKSQKAAATIEYGTGLFGGAMQAMVLSTTAVAIDEKAAEENSIEDSQLLVAKAIRYAPGNSIFVENKPIGNVIEFTNEFEVAFAKKLVDVVFGKTNRAMWEQKYDKLDNGSYAEESKKIILELSKNPDVNVKKLAKELLESDRFARFDTNCFTGDYDYLQKIIGREHTVSFATSL